MWLQGGNGQWMRRCSTYKTNLRALWHEKAIGESNERAAACARAHHRCGCSVCRGRSCTHWRCVGTVDHEIIAMDLGSVGLGRFLTATRPWACGDVHWNAVTMYTVAVNPVPRCAVYGSWSGRRAGTGARAARRDDSLAATPAANGLDNPDLDTVDPLTHWWAPPA